MLFKVGTAIGAAVFLCAGSSASLAADDQTFIAPLDRPDRASVIVPNLAFTPTQHDAGRFDSYFYFYKSGVSYEAAFSDLDQCRVYGLSAKLIGVPPKFVPLGSDVKLVDQQNEAMGYNIYGQYGIVGAIIGSIVIPEVMEGIYNATERRCMSYKGYSRYGLPEAIWHEINAGADRENLAREALIASGTQPGAEAIDP